MSYTLWARKQGLVTTLVEKEPTSQEYHWPPHPGYFNRHRCELLLQGDTSYENFNLGFAWSETPQRRDHWQSLATRAKQGEGVTLSDEDRAYIRHIINTGVDNF